MRIKLLTIGSRGDVQPFVALGQALQRAGHEVTICTTAWYRNFVTSYGLPCFALSNEAASSDAPSDLRRSLDEAWGGCRSAELLVYSENSLAGPHMAEALKIPSILVLTAPSHCPTAAFSAAGRRQAPAVLPGAGALNRLSYRLSPSPHRQKIVQQWRRETLGLAPAGARRPGLFDAEGLPLPVLHAYSHAVLPDPPDWPSCWEATGYWYLKRSRYWEPPSALATFLATGSTPIYIGFGDAGRSDPDWVRLCLLAVQEAGLRAVTDLGWGDMAYEEEPDCVFQAAGTPHDWLFAKVAAVCHHGGAGTAAAGFLAGRPTLVCPNPDGSAFWGQRAHQLGLGPKPLLRKRLTVARLATALRALVDETSYRQAAEELRVRVQAEQGLKRALELIDRALGQNPAPAARYAAQQRPALG